MNTIKEKINEHRAKFILSLSPKEFITLVWSDEKDNNNGEDFMDKATYLKNVKWYLSKQLANECELLINYNYSKEMRKDGRLFAQEFSLQGMKKNLRSFLTSNDDGERYYYDYDMVNAHPSILACMLLDSGVVDDDDDFKNQYPCLFAYTRSSVERKKFLEMAECSKKDILTMMNSPNPKEIFTELAQDINSEFKRIQKIFYNSTPDLFSKFEVFKGETKKNKCGKFLNKLLCITENSILNKVMRHYQENYKFQDTISTIMFDGLYISASLDDQLETLNQLTDECGIEWDIKPPCDDIQNTDIYKNRNADIVSSYESRAYSSVKMRFEKNHFMIEHPVMFANETTVRGVSTVNIYNQSDFKVLTKRIKFYNKKTDSDVGIFETWSGDPECRHYKQLDFIPTLNTNKEIYNTFQGFHYADKKPFTYTTDLIDLFRSTISTLVDHKEECIDYCFKYFAHLFQKPDERPNVAIVWKSGQGYGKDTILDCIAKIMGNDYLYRTPKPDDIFGTFNAALKNKLLVQLNELEGKDGFANKDKLKSLITENITNINEKNMKQYDQSNYVRVIICTNRLNSVEIPSDDRRFVVFEADRRKPSSAHFTKMHGLLSNDDAVYSLYKYLMDYDIGDVELKWCRPITTAYKNMRENNTHPFHIWLKDTLDTYKMHEDEGGIPHKTHKKTGQVLITPDALYDRYCEHMVNTNQEMYNFNKKKMMKDLLTALKVNHRKTKLNGSCIFAYWFDIPQTIEFLNDIVKEDELEEYDDDDFE
jgi:hypothetical protein